MRLPFAALALASLTLASSAFAEDKKPAKPPVVAPAKDSKDTTKDAKDAKHHKAHPKKHGPTAKLDHKNAAKKDDLAKIEPKSAHKKGDPKAAAKTDVKVEPKPDAKKVDPKTDKKVEGDEPPEELTGALPQKKLADKKKKADAKADAKDEKKVDPKADKAEDKKLLLPHGGKAPKTTASTSVEFQKLQKKTFADKKGKMKACLNPAVTFARLGQPTDVSFALTTCGGGTAPGAVDSLSILARPYDIPMPTASSAPSTVLSFPKKGAKPSKALAMPHDEVAPGIRRIDPGMVSRLQSIANHFPGKTITLVSGYRPASKGSPHQAARAFDIRIDGVTNEVLVAYCKTLTDTGCGYYPNSYFVHVDVRPTGAGHVYWIDLSGPGEKPVYVKQWPLPEKAKPADMVKGESKIAAKDAKDAKPETEIAGPAPTTDVKEIGTLEEADEEAAPSSPTN